MPEAKYDQNVNEGLDTLKAYADKRGISSTPTPGGYQLADWCSSRRQARKGR